MTARARVREDRAGDPLDGLVNLFDIGIILSVGFLLAALSSMDLTEAITNPEKANKVPADSVLAKPDETVEQIEIPPGEEVVGRGEPIGRLYRLEDGRTIVVKPGPTGTTGATGATGTDPLPATPATPSAPATP
ncbi:MAG: DUF2149 domain-containing protein [Solirubrobacterales bacterium]|nr:DUF2149 domain-containing protein [Solirubrobacterales bacterium]